MGVHMSTEDHELNWVLVEACESYPDIGKAIGRHLTKVRDFVTKHGGVCPVPSAEWSD